MWDGGHMGSFSIWHLAILLFWLAVLAAVIALIVTFLRRGDPARSESDERRSNALAILEERYARGEMQREEYMQKRRDIEDAA
jgi:putative membrane protein